MPVIKAKNGKSVVNDNYRPIFLMAIFTKIFELCVSARIVPLLRVDDLQFVLCQERDVR